MEVVGEERELSAAELKAPQGLIAQAMRGKLNRDTRPGISRGLKRRYANVWEGARTVSCALCPGPPPAMQGIYFSTASLNAFAGRRRTTVLALILIASPV